jgi:hypothetical protein
MKTTLQRVKPAVNIVTRNGLPALNVKVYRLDKWPNAAYLTANFYGLEQAEAEGMLAQLWDIAVEGFWQDAPRLARADLGNAVTVSSDGRSGGWLVVDGLGDVAEWTLGDRVRWTQFEQSVRGTIAERSSLEWAMPHLHDILDNIRSTTSTERIRDAAPELLEALREAKVESRVNARLIAAAPELLEACRNLLRSLDAGTFRPIVQDDPEHGGDGGWEISTSCGNWSPKLKAR